MCLAAWLQCAPMAMALSKRSNQTGKILMLFNTVAMPLLIACLLFRITFYLTSWKSSKETNLELWRDSLEFALTAIKKLLDDTTPAVAHNSKY